MTETMDRPAAVTTPLSALDEGVLLSERRRWPMLVHLEARLSGRLDRERLRAAVATTLAHHPLLRARAAPASARGRELRWEIPEQPDVDALLPEGDLDEHLTGLLAQRLPDAVSPRLRVALAPCPERPGADRIILIGHHAALDGASLVLVLATIAAAYAGRALPSAGIAPAPAAAAAGGGSSPGRVLDSARGVLLAPRADLLSFSGAPAPQGYGVTGQQLARDLTDALLTRRPPGSTVNDLLLAATHLAADRWNRARGAATGLLSVVMPVHADLPESEHPWAVRNSTLQAVTLTRPDQRSTTARLLDAIGAQTAAVKSGGTAAEPSAALGALGALPVGVRRALPRVVSAVTRERATATTRLSNLGVADPDRFRGLEVESLWFSPPCRPPQPMVLGVVTVGGAVTLTARWCRPQVSAEEATALLQLVLHTLGELLGLEAAPPLAGLPEPASDEPEADPTEGLRRTLHYARLFREEQSRPEQFYTFSARDTVRLVQRYHSLHGARAVDIGGGPGYLADALDSAGARTIVLDYAVEEFTLFGRSTSRCLVGDGRAVPLASSSVDVVVSSNVLEHVAQPERLLAEAVRVLRPGGVAIICFTAWFSPWGGHETSPWHLLGGEYAARRYERTSHLPAKNRFGESLFAVHVGQVLRWGRRTPGVRVLDAFPRYLPSWMSPLVRVPGVREVATWNLALVLTPDRA